MRNIVLPYFLMSLFSVQPLTVAAASQLESSVQVAVVDQQHSARLDLNKADAVTLQSRLVGIGRAKAEAIVTYREEHGPFMSVDELLEIKGIGKALLERNRDKLVVNP